jgi:hypothetical protein
MIENHDAPSALARFYRAQQTGCARADNNDIRLSHFRDLNADAHKPGNR